MGDQPRSPVPGNLAASALREVTSNPQHMQVVQDTMRNHESMLRELDARTGSMQAQLEGLAQQSQGMLETMQQLKSMLLGGQPPPGPQPQQTQPQGMELIQQLLQSQQQMQAQLVSAQAGQQALLEQILERRGDPGMHKLPSGVKTTLPTYDGKPGTDVEIWIFGIEEYFGLHGIQHDNMKVRLMGQALTSQALEWYRLQAQVEDMDNLKWDSFKAILKKMFVPVDSEMETINKFDALTQGKKTVQTYTLTFKHLAWALEGFKSGYSEKILVHKYQRGLSSSDIREKILLAMGSTQGCTLEDAVNIATTMTHTRGQAGHREEGGSATGASGSSTPMELGTMRAGPAYSQAELTEIKRLKEANLCLNCGSADHKAASTNAEGKRVYCPNAPTGSHAVKFQAWRKAGNGKRAAQKGGH